MPPRGSHYEPPSWLGVGALAVLVLYAGRVAWRVWSTSYFCGDDFQALQLLRVAPLGRALLVPLGAQIVPLHRLFTFALQRLFPMNFAVATGALLAFHGIAVWYLYRILETLGASRINLLLISLYGTNVFFGNNLAWFTSGTTRFPYIAFSLVALFHYLRYGRTRSRLDLAGVVAAYVAALGFYSKAILIPFYCLGLEVARAREPEEGTLFRRDHAAMWILAGCLIAAGGLYVPVARALTDPISRVVNGNLASQIEFQKLGWTILVHGLFGYVLEFEAYRPSWLLMGGCLAFVAYSVARARAAMLAWASLAALLSMNFLVIGMSSRTVTWGNLMAFEYRHYFELVFLVILFLKIVLRRMELSPRSSWVPKALPFRVLTAAWAVLLPVQATVSFARSERLEARYGQDLLSCRRYMRRLLADLKERGVNANPTAVFLDGPIPEYLNRMDFGFHSVSDLFLAVGIPARFASGAGAEYAVTPTGAVIPLHPATEPTRGARPGP